MSRCRLLTRGRAAVLLSAAILSSLSEAGAQNFYQGKNLSLIVGNTAGSGYDTYGRLVARYMSKHLPGRPGIITQNMPGAGSVKAADFLFNIAPKDGTVFGTIMPGALVDPLATDPKKYRYEPAKFEYLGTADSGTKICFSSARSGIKSIEDTQKVKVTVASTARADYTHMMNSMLRTRFHLVTGYPGPGDMLMALERGEGDVICGLDFSAVNAMRPGLIGSDKVNVLMQFGLEPRSSLTALGVPEIWKYLAPADRPVVELIVTEQVFQRVFLAPPGTPAERLAVLRAAFDAAMTDAELLAEAKKINLEINPKSGNDVASRIKAMYAAPQEVVARMSKVTRP